MGATATESADGNIEALEAYVYQCLGTYCSVTAADNFDRQAAQRVLPGKEKQPLTVPLRIIVDGAVGFASVSAKDVHLVPQSKRIPEWLKELQKREQNWTFELAFFRTETMVPHTIEAVIAVAKLFPPDYVFLLGLAATPKDAKIEGP